MKAVYGKHNSRIDLPFHEGKRKILVKELKSKGIKNEAVLSVIEKLPRHFFLDPTLEDQAYSDKALPISSGQTISQPYTVARQTELLDIKPGMKVLEIGTGSGYQAAVLLLLGVELYSIERIAALHDHAVSTLKFLNLPTQGLVINDGTIGLEAAAPFDRILVTAGAPAIPKPLFDQLKVGGCLVIPVGDSQSQEMIRCYKSPTSSALIEKHGNFSFVPLKGQKGW